LPPTGWPMQPRWRRSAGAPATRTWCPPCHGAFTA
jgi:hypothetical protein